jgi:hypothetical protein
MMVLYSLPHSLPSQVILSDQNTLQPKLSDLCTDEKGRFPIYGPASYVVAYNRDKNSFYEVCEAIWAHWMRIQHEQLALGADDVFYWIDVFAVPHKDVSQPVAAVAEDGGLEKVRPASSFLRPIIHQWKHKLF